MGKIEFGAVGRFNPSSGAVSMPEIGQSQRCYRGQRRAEITKNRNSSRFSALRFLSEAFCDDFFGPNQFPAPEKPASHTHHDAAVLFGKIGRLVADDTMKCPIYMLLRFNLFHLEPVQDLHQRVNGILQVVAPWREVTTLVFLVGGVSQLLGETGEIVEEHDEVMNERLLQ